MSFSAAQQTAMIARMPGKTEATVGANTITVDFRTESVPVMYDDGSIEQGKPYCIASAADVAANNINHGTALVINSVTWYVIGKTQKQDGMFRLVLSVTP